MGVNSDHDSRGGLLNVNTNLKYRFIVFRYFFFGIRYFSVLGIPTSDTDFGICIFKYLGSRYSVSVSVTDPGCRYVSNN